MRITLTVLVVLGLVAAPSLGVVNVKLTADGPIVDNKVQLANGATTTIRVWGQGTNSGLYSLAGDIRAGAADPILLTSNPPMVFTPSYSPITFFYPRPGTPGDNGGCNQFGTQQTEWGTPDVSLGKNAYVEVCHYTVTAAAVGTGDVTLHFSTSSVGGYKPLETDKTGILGVLTPVTIHVTPEPMTMALLAVAGLVALRRRHA